MTARPTRVAAIALAALGLCAAAGAGDEPRVLDCTQGAARIPFDMPADGQATIALYTPTRRLVRALAQGLELDKGRYALRWDGMDLWGRLVPAGTELEAKVFSGPGLRAVYEFTVGNAASPPWLTRPRGEGLAMRAGGWMGDHTPPISAVAFGRRVFFGCEVAEHGHALIATDLEGRKLWGRGGLAGWRGPAILASDGRCIFGAADKLRKVYRIDPATYKCERVHDAGKDTIQALAAREGRVYLVLQNHEARESPFLASVDGRSIDYARSRPVVAKGGSTVSGQLDNRGRFATVFYRGGHPQTQVRSVRAGGMACVLLALSKPTPVGTIVLGRVPDAARDAPTHTSHAGGVIARPSAARRPSGRPPSSARPW